MDVFLTIVDDDADALARRLVSDINELGIEAEANLVSRPAGNREKGAIEAVGSVAVAVLGSSGIEPLVGLFRDLATRGSPIGSHQREIELTTPDGKTVKLNGRMSDEQFAALTDRILRLFEGGPLGDTP